MIEFPERIPLARLPTPLQHLPRTSAVLGVETWIKRDDMTGLELSGNKVRKLEFLMAEAREQSADVVITCGGEQSNHCRATAVAAAKLGMGSVLLLRTADPDHPPGLTGNILLDQLVGAEIIWISHAEYQRRHELMASLADQLRSAGKAPYVIPEGGSNAVGSWGYIACAAELAQDLAPLPEKPTTVVYACGSGGTGAGLILGGKLADFDALDVRIAGFNVCDDRAYFLRTIGRICSEFTERFSVGCTVKESDIDIVDGYVGRGYSKTQPEELATLVAMSRREGILLDPVYSGKAFHGLCTELAADRGRFGERVVFVHTGGVFGLFPAAAELAEVL